MTLFLTEVSWWYKIVPLTLLELIRLIIFASTSSHYMQNKPPGDTVLDSIYELLATTRTASFSAIVQRRLTELGISDRQLSNAIGVSRTSLSRLLSGDQKKIDLLTLLKLSQLLGADVRDLAQAYVSSADSEEIGRLDRAKRHGFILANFDLKELKHVGFISSLQDLDAVEQRIVSFFGFSSVFEYSSSPGAIAFSRTQRASAERTLRFWVSVVNAQLRRLANPHPYDREKLKALVPKLRVATLDPENGFRWFVRALWECGVTVVVESYMPKTQIRGGTMSIDGRPGIVLTNLGKKYPTLWWSLAHELCHVVRDLDLIEQQGYHLSGADDLFQDQVLEQSANEFASNLLIPEEKLSYITRFIEIEDLVAEYARQWNVHPSIIYSQFLYAQAGDRDSDVHYAKFSRLIPSSDLALRNMHIDLWKQESIEATLPQIQKSLQLTAS